MKCSYPRCRQENVIFIGVGVAKKGLCQKHWEQHCEKPIERGKLL